MTYKNIGCIASLVPDTGSTSGKGTASDLVKIISNILGLKDLSTLDSSTTLGSLGIDSLIAVEIKQGIEGVVGLSLSIKEIRNLTVLNLQELASKGDLQVSRKASNEELKKISNEKSKEESNEETKDDSDQAS